MSSRADCAAAYRQARNAHIYTVEHKPKLAALSFRLVRALGRELAKEKVREKFVRVNLTKEDQALAVLAAHPGWSNKQIATEIQTPATYLSKMPRFRAAREAVKQGRERFRGADVVDD